MVDNAHLRSREYVLFQGSYFGMSCCYPDYGCKLNGGYLGRYVSGYLGGRGGHFVASHAAFVVSMFQRWIHQNCVCQTRG